MAIKNIEVANPTSLPVTVNGKTAGPNTLTLLQLDDTVPGDAYGFLAAGCALVSKDNATFQQREQGGFILEREESLG